MSKSHYLQHKTLHSLPKFASKTQRIQVGNRQFISVLFIIPIVTDIHGHRFNIFTLVSEMHENVDLVFGIKNIFELLGVINSWESCFSFLNTSNTHKDRGPVIEEISGLAIIKMLRQENLECNDVKT